MRPRQDDRPQGQAPLPPGGGAGGRNRLLAHTQAGPSTQSRSALTPNLELSRGGVGDLVRKGGSGDAIVWQAEPVSHLAAHGLQACDTHSDSGAVAR